MIYLLDTNSISYLLRNEPQISAIREERVGLGHIIGLCQPIHYEVLRGLYKNHAKVQLTRFIEDIVPIYRWFELENADWLQAAQFWAQATSKGQQLSDVDLLLAALSKRLDAIIVSSDADFDSLPVKRENWRMS